MNLLDRHIARRYLVNVAALLAAMFAFVVVVDLFLKFDEYTKSPSALRRTALTGLAVIDLWGPRLLQLFNYLAGLSLVAGMGFTCASLVRHRELVAALASGVSLHRLIRPIFLSALGVTVVQGLNQEFAIPRVAHLLTRDVDDVSRRQIEPFRVQLLEDGQGRLFYARRFDPEAGVLQDVRIWERDESGRLTRRLRAASAVWTGDAWRLEQGRAERPGQGGAGQSGQNLSWRRIAEALSQKEVVPIDQRTRDRLNRVRFGRVSLMISNLLVVLIAVPFFLTRLPMSMVRQSLKCAPLAGFGMIGAVLGVSAPLPGLPVAAAVFFPPMVLTPLAIASLCSMKT